MYFEKDQFTKILRLFIKLKLNSHFSHVKMYKLVLKIFFSISLAAPSSYVGSVIKLISESVKNNRIKGCNQC